MGTYAKVNGKILQKMMKQPVFAVLSHWLFQSLFYMDTTERWFKIGLDVVTTLLIRLFLSLWMVGVIPWFIAFFLAHTLNFLFNGQLWGVLKHYGLIHVPREDFEKYVLAFRDRARDEQSIDQVLIFGSMARGSWKESSDLDARIIRKTGMLNAFSVCAFLLLERTKALFYIFPLDMYIVDNSQSTGLLKLKEAAKDLLCEDWKFE